MAAGQRLVQTLKEETDEELVARTDALFDALQLADLQLAPRERLECGRCGKRRLFYCWQCQVPMRRGGGGGNSEGKEEDEDEDKERQGTPWGLPELRLPCPIDVVRHHKEKLSKATSVHGAVLCPSQVTMHTFVGAETELPAWDPATTVLLFPGAGATKMDDIDLRRVQRVVVVESTWNQVGAVLRHPRVAALPKVTINRYATRFWRYQSRAGITGLATIEAMYYVMRELRARQLAPRPYDGSVDNMLYIFTLIYEGIQRRYRDNPELRYTSKHVQQGGYIRDRPSAHADKVGAVFAAPESAAAAAAAAAAAKKRRRGNERMKQPEQG